MTAFRAIARALAVPIALAVAVIAQLAVVNRLPLPGGAAPDLVLLVVVAVALNTSPMSGLLTGFAGGLALDVAPPASHLAGEYALVFCLVGYACGRARKAILYSAGELAPLVSLTLMAVGVAVGEAGKVALGLLVSDPDVTTPAVRHLLPLAIIYDLVLCPFVLWLVSRVFRQPAPAGAPRPEFSPVAAAVRGVSVASFGSVPKLRLAGSTPAPARPPARQEPKLRLAGGRSSSSSGTISAFSPAQHPVPGGRTPKLNFSRSGSAAAKPRQRSSPGKGWLRPAPAAGLAVPRTRSPGKGWPVTNLSAPGKGWLRAGRPVAAAAPKLRSPAAPKFKSPAKGWARQARPVAAPRFSSPPKGWIRPAKPVPAPKLKSPPKGWIRPAKPAPPPRRKSPGRGWVRPAKPVKQSWYAKPPSTRWVRRSQSPWPGRRTRLLALMGGRR